jgi:hypothetical protein
MDENQAWPPDSNGVYVVAEHTWLSSPSRESIVLYVGGNSSASPLFLTRVGSLVADMLGFWWHHSGGQSIYRHCEAKGLHPLDLHLGWVGNIPCPRCGEKEIHDALKPLLAKKVPPRCPKHAPPLLGCL